MNTRQFFLISLLWLILFSLSAQRTISGRITEAYDN